MGKAVKVTTEYDVVCEKCGAGLEAQYSNGVIFVELCDYCLESARKKSSEEGPILHDGELIAECRERAIETALCAIPQEANIYIDGEDKEPAKVFSKDRKEEE